MLSDLSVGLLKLEKNMQKKLISLSPRQIVSVVLPIAVVALFTCISFINITNDIIEARIIDDVNALNEKIEYEVRLNFEPPATAVTIVGEGVENSNGSDRDMIDAMVRGMGKLYPQCAAIYYATAEDVADGGYLCMSDDWKAPAGWSQLQRPWFTGAVSEGGQLYASEIYVNARFGKPCISFSKAVYDRRHRLLGVAGCDIPLEELSKGLNGLSVSANNAISIVDQNGMFLSYKDPSVIMKNNLFEFISLKKYTAKTFLTEQPKSFIEGGRYYGVRKIGGSPWFAVVEGPVSDFTGAFKFWIKIILLIVGLLILLNLVVTTIELNKMKAKEKVVSDKLFSETQNLVVAAKENAATSQDQSAAVKEIVATMEDNNALSENVATKIKDVAGVANKTNADVTDGVSYLEQNVAQLKEIAAANLNTIEGIKALGDKIENIWDIVTLINSVADQAKIIAFNAELEASSAGEAGKNFHIVATEIRRLADGIIDGTKEIKERIGEIQQSSDSLILASENGTEKINSGVESAKSLSERFESIKHSSEVTSGSANDITAIIQQQAIASEQILITLKQISAGVENFTVATESISSASQNLNSIAEDLNK